MRWLALHAFVTVLGRKQARYGALLAELRQEMKDEAFALLPSQLAPVVDPKRSPAFRNVIY